MTPRLPQGWRTALIGEVCEVVSGSTPRRNRSEYWGGDIDWVTPKDLTHLDGAVLREAPEKITLAGFKSCSTNMLPEGSVLFSSRAPIGLVAIAGRPLCTNQGFKSLIPGPAVDSPYLYWCMRFLTRTIQAQGTGTTFAEVSKRVMERIALPIPPLPEQRRIAAILDKADAIRRKRREAIALVESLLRSTFLDMFGDPAGNARAYPVTHLAELIRANDRLNYGVVQPGQDVAEGVPLIRAGDFQDGHVASAGLKRISHTIEAKYSRSRLRGDEVLVACVGSIGAAALAHTQHRGFNIARAVARVPLEHSLARREYILWYLRTPYIQHYFSSETRTVAQPTLNIRQLKTTPVVLPPLAEQARFVQFAQRVDGLQAKTRRSAEASDTLFHALVQRAFRGDL